MKLTPSYSYIFTPHPVTNFGPSLPAFFRCPRMGMCLLIVFFFVALFLHEMFRSRMECLAVFLSMPDCSVAAFTSGGACKGAMDAMGAAGDLVTLFCCTGASWNSCCFLIDRSNWSRSVGSSHGQGCWSPEVPLERWTTISGDVRRWGTCRGGHHQGPVWNCKWIQQYKKLFFLKKQGEIESALCFLKVCFRLQNRLQWNANFTKDIIISTLSPPESLPSSTLATCAATACGAWAPPASPTGRSPTQRTATEDRRRVVSFCPSKRFSSSTVVLSNIGCSGKSVGK